MPIRCTKCGYVWEPRYDIPSRCPNCRSKIYDNTHNWEFVKREEVSQPEEVSPISKIGAIGGLIIIILIVIFFLILNISNFLDNGFEVGFILISGLFMTVLGIPLIIAGTMIIEVVSNIVYGCSLSFYRLLKLIYLKLKRIMIK